MNKRVWAKMKHSANKGGQRVTAGMRVLIADDSLVSRHLLEATLKGWGYDVCVACDGAEAWHILEQDDAPALAILDWMMPGLTGPEVCRQVRQKAKEPYTYILLLTSKSLKEDVVAGMDSGADDYLTKPFDQHELKVRLRAGTRIVDLQAQLLDTREALRQQATHDYLTQLWNRSSVLEILSREMIRSGREHVPVGVVLADLDHFKSINDTYGHLAGDFALKESAQRMQHAMRSYDAIGRYGGEEFLIVLPGCGEADTEHHAERMRAEISRSELEFGGVGIKLSASFGCTSFCGDPGTIPAERLIAVADAALYRAKREGRNRVVYSSCEVGALSIHQ